VKRILKQHYDLVISKKELRNVTQKDLCVIYNADLYSNGRPDLELRARREMGAGASPEQVAEAVRRGVAAQARENVPMFDFAARAAQANGWPHFASGFAIWKKNAQEGRIFGPPFGMFVNMTASLDRIAFLRSCARRGEGFYGPRKYEGALRSMAMAPPYKEEGPWKGTGPSPSRIVQDEYR
jgi:hypothetical protein